METQRRTGLHGRVRSGRFSRMVLMLGALLAAGCSDSDPLQPDPSPEPGAEDPNTHPTFVAPFVRRVDLEFEAVGAFRPGQPVTIISIARGRRPAAEVDFSLVVLDEETPVGAEPSARRVSEFRGGMGRGQSQRLNASLTFAKPGFYRVVASARTRRPADEVQAPGDSVIGNFSSETLYLLIDENGGRATRQHDPSAAAGRTPLYGSFGPFVQSAPASASRSTDTGLQTTGAVSGVFWVYNDSTGTHERLGNTQGYADCRTSTGSIQRLNFTVAADGTFGFTCASGVYTGRIDLRNADADVYGHGGAFAGATFDQYTGAYPSLQASNQYAGYVFSTMARHIPTARARFGRSRPVITAWVSDYDTNYPIQYCPTINTAFGCTRADVVMSNFKRVFGEDGIFVTMHEYGHAYHHRAIEALPSSYSCNPSGHYYDVPHNLSCAFVEGFADFFSAWLLSSRLTNSYYSDNIFETKRFSGTRGVETEGAAAGFFYDLADGAGDPDAANNTVFEEWFDDAVYPGSFIANIMANCAPWTRTSTGGYTYTYTLDGMDQVVYCIEGNVNAETVGPLYGSGWRTQWDGVSWSPTFSYPTGYNATTVRRLWLYNFYGVNP